MYKIYTPRFGIRVCRYIFKTWCNSLIELTINYNISKSSKYIKSTRKLPFEKKSVHVQYYYL